ncbi:MAG: site-specific integrase [Bacteroidaceae bacterium]|nr:site-specific integrase [Bacteroidaceae bacterium]
MAAITIMTRNKRRDGFCPVYICISHQSKKAYISTGKLVTDKGRTKTGEVTDPIVNGALAPVVNGYIQRMNMQDISKWTVQQLAEYLKSGDEDICFSDYARQHADRMVDAGQHRTARNYQLALQHMERYAGTTKIMFSMLTSHFINGWIKTMENTHRAKEMYPISMRQVFKAAVTEYNDYDTGLIRIKTNPWPKVKIPTADRAQKLAITPEECRAFFDAPLPESKMRQPLPELGRDVAMLILCLGGINTIDLYELHKEDYYDGIIHYKRAKTKKFRADEAYMEMRVPDIVKPLFDKYANTTDTDALFNFAVRHTTADSFCANVNIGIRAICASMGMAKENDYCAYTFRHTWGTVAQNHCGASIADVAFGMNHSSGHKVTRGYLKLDFSPAWVLNEKVIDRIFNNTQSDENYAQKSSENMPDFFRLSPKYMVRATATLRGKQLAEVHDIGFANVDEVIDALVEQFPDTLPDRIVVKFKIVNIDKEQVWTGERMKGKGF